jgi:ribonuclease P protein component
VFNVFIKRFKTKEYFREDKNHENDLSAKQTQESKNPRIPQPHGNCWRTQCNKTQKGKRQKASCALIQRHYPNQWRIVSNQSSSERLVKPALAWVEKQIKKLNKNGFQKKEHIIIRSDFERIKNSGMKAHDRHIFAVFIPSAAGNTRIGITVTKRVGNAVTRNRIRRFVREFYRQNRNLLKGMWDINFIARHSAAEAAHEDINTCLTRIFKKISDNYAD